MDKGRGRKPTFTSQTSIAPKAVREDFKPAVEWTEDQSNRILHIHLPGFKREEIRVQLDNARKLLIKGVKLTSDKHISVDLSFDVPDDTISEKISGKFEDERLTLVMPKTVVKRQEEVIDKGKAISEDKGKEHFQNETPNNLEPKKEEEDTNKEAKTNKDKKGEERKYQPTSQDKSTATEAMQSQLTQKEKPKSNEDSKHETIQNLISEAKEVKKDDSPISEEKLEKGEGKKDEPVEESESIEKKKEDPLQAMIKAVERGREENTIQKKVREMCVDKPKEIIKRVSTWKDAENSYGSLDGILEKMNRNRKLIGVAVVAFSVGFYVSRKLRTRAR